MAVEFVAASDWAVVPWDGPPVTVDVPAAAAPGDMAVAVAVNNHGLKDGYRPWLVLGGGPWSLAYRWVGPTTIWPYLAYEVATALVTEPGLSVSVGRPKSGTVAARVVVFRNVGGVGRYASSAGLSVQPDGGVVVLGHDAVTNASPVWTDAVAGLSFIAPPVEFPAEGANRHRVYWDAESGGFAGLTESKVRAHSFELLPPALPSAPVPYSPAVGAEVGAGAGGTAEVAWSHRSNMLLGQSAYQLRATAAGITRYWDVAAGVWGAPETVNESRDQYAVVGTGVWAAGDTVEWQVRTREAAATSWSPWSTASSFLAVDPAVVTVTAPAGTVRDDLSPLVTWDVVTPRGEQTAYRVRVRDAAGGIVHDSGVQYAPVTEYRVPIQAWVNGATYTVQVEVQQTGGSWSAVAETSIVMAWTPPPAPQVAVFPYRPGVQVTVRAGAGMFARVERSEDGGRSWQLVTGDGTTGAAGELVVHDVLAPYGRAVEYRVRVREFIDPLAPYSEWAITSPVINKDEDAYLVRDDDPAVFLPVTIHEDRRGGDGPEAFVSAGFGGGRWVDYGDDHGRDGTLTLTAYNPDQREEVRAWVRSAGSLRVRFPAEADYPGEVIRMAVSSRPTVARRVQYAGIPWRDVTFDWVEIL